MAASVETNLASACESKSDGVARISVKKEIDVIVKPEPHECIVCSLQSNDTADIYATKTSISQTSLHVFLFKHTNVDLAELQNCPKHMCTSCLDLINILEQAESEYIRLKQAFEEIISKNPLFECNTLELELNPVKSETISQEYNDIDHFDRDSEDEPLSVTKKKRKGKLTKKKKKQNTTTKRKTNSENESWECDICGMQSTSGGLAAATAHKIVKHSIHEGNSILGDVKKEDGSQSPSPSNGYADSGGSLFKIEMEVEVEEDEGVNEKGGEAVKRRRRAGKASHKCDVCAAAYTSATRLRLHRAKHEDAKPPFICEVCGAHYKHKRACDIHVALHRGISDWKCTECDKLFPSKGALQRHNNIHTGQLNYQCDLCGKSFIHTSSFKMHKLSHSGLKPHSCDVCGLALMTRSHLKRHKRVHSGEKRHECGVCGKRFSERYNLVAHSKSHDAPPAPAPDAAPAPPRRRLFRCAFCPERFERRYMLERHCGAAHGRALERPPPTPRNTMSKLLKAQAQRRVSPAPAPKDEPAPPAPAPPSIPVSAWSNTYAGEFGLH